MKAFVFPGQGSQFPGMGKDLHEKNQKAKERFEEANDILGFSITDVMFFGSEDDLKETRVTQPAIFLHSVILAESLPEDVFIPDMVAGHSLGEFSALVAAGSIGFKDGLQLVAKRAEAMQRACEVEEGTMAAVLGLDDDKVREICDEVDGAVAANYNSPGQVVISGRKQAIEKATEKLQAAGAKRVLNLPVGGAFHSPLMEPARQELAEAIDSTEVKGPRCAIYQNVPATPVVKPDVIKDNLVKQLTAPVRWTQTMQNMIANGADEAIEVGPGKVLQGLFKKIDRGFAVSSAGIDNPA